MTDRFPGYDVLSKRDGLSWNPRTRDVIDTRLALDAPRFLDLAEHRTLGALANRIVPQPDHQPPIDVAAIIDDSLAKDECDGFRDSRMPPARQAWQQGLAAIDTEARTRRGRSFADLDGTAQDALIAEMAAGTSTDAVWESLSPALFFTSRVLPDIVAAYYAHPSAWSAIGFGGPAAPRGYVRLDADRHDAWEATELKPGGDPATVIRQNRRVG